MRPPWKQQQEKQEDENVREALKEDNYDVHTEGVMLIFHLVHSSRKHNRKKVLNL